ncbi:MAG: hypothetical protein AMS27_09445 [Bacteroides sp. SM23_62_1]|nr:MAG: hypothetical protein AMS27_09445 [Bacteroides sp. SM23_62_1]
MKHELASGVRYDSIFMGIYLGMEEKDFYTHCWLLNREGLIRQGTSNTTVEYQVKEELKNPGTMDFYPVFENEVIVEMPVRFRYNGWTPWNEELSSDKLQEDVLRWYKKCYGSGFITVKHPDRGRAFVKVDGNRRITIFKEDDIHVWAVFTDMLAKREMPDTITGGIINKDIVKELGK